MSKYCPECGEKIERNPKFCPECGTNLSKEDDKDKKNKIKRKHDKKEDITFSLERYFKDCFLLAIASIVFSCMIAGFSNFPIRHMLHDVQLIHNFFIDWIFWSLVFFAIFLLIAYWKKLQKRDIKIFVFTISIAFIFILIILGYNTTLDAGEVRVVDYDGHTNYGFYYYVNGTVENTGDIYQNARIYIYFYDSTGRVIISDDLYPRYDIPPHSTETFYFSYFYGYYEDTIDTFYDVDHITVKCETFGYE